MPATAAALDAAIAHAETLEAEARTAHSRAVNAPRPTRSGAAWDTYRRAAGFADEARWWANRLAARA